jgi:hypothetical protein
MIEHARSGYMEITLVSGSPSSFISIDPIRAALVKALEDFVAETKEQLRLLGVEVDL